MDFWHNLVWNNRSARRPAAGPLFGTGFAPRAAIRYFYNKSLILRRFKKIVKWFFLSLLLLLLALYLFILSPWGQNWIGQQVTKRLSKTLHTKVTVKRVSFRLLNRMHLEDLLVEDQRGDTLLFAGDMQVRITDWFVFRKNAELKYIGLSNALIKFQRTDSVWSQQFLFDQFGGSSKDSASSSGGGIRFNLKKAELNNVTFLKKDGWLGADLSVSVKALRLDASSMPFGGGPMVVNSLLLDEPRVALRNYTRRKPPTPRANEEEETTAAAWNPGGMELRLGELRIRNGQFSTDREGRTPYAHFDGQHILFSEVNASFRDLLFAKDTITSVMQLTTRERSGLEVKRFDAQFRFTPQQMAFTNMELQTNRSTLRHAYTMSYRHMDELGDYIHKVKMDADFEDTYVDSDDIAFFAPAMASWKKKIALKGRIRGTVDELVGRDLQVMAGANTLLNGDLSLTGLPDINQTFIDLRATDFRTNYTDVSTLVPALRGIRQPDLRKLSYVQFRGNFTGFIRDFVTFGTLNTNLGTLITDLNMKLPAGKAPIYSGNIETANFRLGELLGNPDLGSISAKATVKGSGFNAKQINTTLNAQIRHLDYKKYRYQQLTVNGQLVKRRFEGEASVNEENAKARLRGTLDFNARDPLFDFFATVDHADLRKLQLTRDSIIVKGELDAQFTSTNIDAFLGKAAIRRADITKNGLRIPFDSLVVEAFNLNDEKVLMAESNEFSARVRGQYRLGDLPGAFTYLLSRYYPSYVKPPKTRPLNQDFEFELETYYVDDYVQLFLPGFSGFNNAQLKGRLNLDNEELRFKADVPQFSLNGYQFDFANVEAEGMGGQLQLRGGARSIRINDSLSIPMASFRIQAANDSSRVSITSGANRRVDTANLNALVMTYPDGVRIEVSPSTFTVNGKTWNIDENGELEFRRNTPASGTLVMTEGDQKITLRSAPSKKGSWNDVTATLEKINLGDFAPFFLPRNRLEGLLSGTVLVEDPAGQLRVSSQDIRTQYLRMDNDSIGEITGRLGYDKESGLLTFDGNTVNKENYLGFTGTLHPGDPDRAPENKISLTARKYPLKILERFLGSLFSDIRGYLTGNVELDGDFSRIAVSGKGRITEAGLKVLFTQCFYKIRDTDIELTPKRINLDGIVLTDTITGNPIYLSGGMEHESFRNMFYNLDIGTRKPGTRDAANNRPVQLLRTTARDNKTFYGDVKGTGLLQLRGPQSDMFMKIDGEASDRDSSYITIPSYVGRESGIADFLVERKYGREMTAEDLAGNSTRITYDVDLTANPMVTVRVILDELTGDVIKGRGNGSLNIRSGTTEPLTMRGRFNISEGDYLFTFQSFFKRPFELRKNAGNYIEWNGDPYNATVQLEALYKSENVSFAPLAELFNMSDLSRLREDVYVAARLTGNLFKPNFSFRLEFPANSRASNDPAISLNVRQIEKNENEMNKQVAYLIVFNSFAPVSTNSLGNPINEFALSTFSSISGLLFNEINKVLSNTLARIFKSDKIGFNISGSLYNRNLLSQTSSGLLPNQSQLDINIPISLFKDRFFINIGSTVDVPLQSGGNIPQSLRFLPDVTLEWLINDAGTLRASFFYRENTDFLNASSNGGPGLARRYGGNISYRKDFDRVGELFRRKKAKPLNPAPPVRDSIQPPL